MGELDEVRHDRVEEGADVEGVDEFEDVVHVTGGVLMEEDFEFDAAGFGVDVFGEEVELVLGVLRGGGAGSGEDDECGNGHVFGFEALCLVDCLLVEEKNGVFICDPWIPRQVVKNCAITEQQVKWAVFEQGMMPIDSLKDVTLIWAIWSDKGGWFRAETFSLGVRRKTGVKLITSRL